MKHKIITTKMGYAKRNRGAGGVDWALLAKRYPERAEQIKRLKNSPAKLLSLRARLEK
jgi:hypothetical protein